MHYLFLDESYVLGRGQTTIIMVPGLLSKTD